MSAAATVSSVLVRAADLLVVCGPSGAGKSSLITRLLKEFPSAFGYSVSHTTRPMRAGETDGVSYHFVTPDAFRALADAGEFVEHAIVHGTMYGTGQSSIRKVVLEQNRVCTMDLDIVGAQNLRRNTQFNSVIVFVQPPTFAELEQRLRARGTETEERLQTRLTNAVKEIAWHKDNESFFDFSLVNDNIDACYEEFRTQVLTKAFLKQAPPHTR